MGCFASAMRMDQVDTAKRLVSSFAVRESLRFIAIVCVGSSLDISKNDELITCRHQSDWHYSQLIRHAIPYTSGPSYRRYALRSG